MGRRPRRPVAALAIVLAAAPLMGHRCTDRVEMVLDLSGDGKLFDAGFPTDLRLLDDGHLDLAGYPRAGHALTDHYVEVIEEDTLGWPPVMPLYLRLTGPIDAAALPSDPAAYESPGAPVQVIDIDPDSPERGRRFPLEVKPTILADRYRPEWLLQALPVIGIPLREATTYAFVATDDLAPSPGFHLRANPALTDLLLGLDPGGAHGPRAVDVYAPLAALLALEGVAPERVIAATVWTTGRTSEELSRIAERLDAWPAPVPEAPLALALEYPTYCVLESSWRVPGFQSGTVPFYAARDGGRFEFDATGDPVPQQDRLSPFVVTIPKAPMPAAGWPLLFYIHGTSGTSAQVHDRGRDPGDGLREPGGGPARIAAGRGWAAAGMGSFLAPEHLSPEATVNGQVGNNLFNPRAMRGNYQQYVAERLLFRRLLNALEIDPALCPGADGSASPDGPMRFDADMQVIQGHSLGSVTGGSLAAVDPMGAQGLVLSGSGASWLESIFGPTDPLPTQTIVEVLALQLPPWERLDRWHPMVAFAELAMGTADTIHLLPRVLRDPVAGRFVPHVLVVNGYRDTLVTDNMQRAVVGALGVDLAGPEVGPFPDGQILPRILLAGGARLDYPAGANRLVPGVGPRTALAVRYPEDGIRGGHDVLFQLGAPKHQVGCFLEDLAAGRAPTVPEGVAEGGICFP